MGGTISQEGVNKGKHVIKHYDRRYILQNVKNYQYMGIQSR